MSDAREFLDRIQNGGGLAFPGSCPAPGGGTLDWQGMTMRQWYAGQALMGLLAAREGPTCPWIEDSTAEPVTKAAFAIADAMLKAEQP